MKNFLNRVKATKGMSGVLVSLLLVIVGVGLVAGVNVYMGSAKTAMLAESDIQITKALGKDFVGTK